jgi:hypothetical protein
MGDERNRDADIPHGTDEENSRIGREPDTKTKIVDPGVRNPNEEVAEPGKDAGNPPRTTSGGITAPKFGAAGSGGAEFEPGAEKD